MIPHLVHEELMTVVVTTGVYMWTFVKKHKDENMETAKMALALDLHLQSFAPSNQV